MHKHGRSGVPVLVFLVAALVAALPAVTAAACDIDAEPRLVLTAVSAGCERDPIAQCLSDISLDIRDATTCAVRINETTLSAGVATVRLQRLWAAEVDGGLVIPRNAMDAAVPWVGDEVYASCLDRIKALDRVAGVAGAAGTAASALAALFNTIDTADRTQRWAVAADSNATRGLVVLSSTAPNACTLTYRVMYDPFGEFAPAAPGDAALVGAAALPSLPDGTFALPVSKNGSGDSVVALCPSGTFSSRSTAIKTAAFECQPTIIGTASNRVGHTTANGTVCAAGTVAHVGTAMCLPCARNTFAPIPGMLSCWQCSYGVSPFEGSPRCLAGFGGRVFTTEGLDVKRSGPGGLTPIYILDNALDAMFGEDAPPAPAGQVYVFSDNTVDNVHRRGGPVQGWSVFTWGAAAGGTVSDPLSLPFIDDCVTTGADAAAYIEDTLETTVLMLGSALCSRVETTLEDVIGITPELNMGTYVNLTLIYATPTHLVAFGVNSTQPGRPVILSVKAPQANSTTSSLELYEMSEGGVAPTGRYAARSLLLEANNFGGDVGVDADHICPEGTSYDFQADSLGYIFVEMCRPCPDGFYCAGRGRNTGPRATPCPSGSRGTVFGQKSSTGCLSCKVGYAQSTPGSTSCDVCFTSTGSGTGVCPGNCPDGQEGSTKIANGCRACNVSYYRSGDMPACLECPAGYQTIRSVTNATGTFLDEVVDLLGANNTGGEDCRVCPPGWYNNRGENTTDPNLVGDPVGKCTPCPAGSFNPRGGAAFCFQCPRGSFQNATGATTCKKTPKGKFQSRKGASTEGTSCPPGTYNELSGGQAENGCLPCRPGTVNPKEGATFCMQCKVGEFQDRQGQTKCKKCPAGSVGTGQPGATSCAICPPGQFSAGPGSTSCVKCPVGTYGPKARQSGCTLCPPGMFCSQAGVVAPEECPENTYNPRGGGTSKRLACVPCNPKPGRRLQQSETGIINSDGQAGGNTNSSTTDNGNNGWVKKTVKAGGKKAGRGVKGATTC